MSVRGGEGSWMSVRGGTGQEEGKDECEGRDRTGGGEG